MGWSTREVAKLAGTSLRTVRHYHDVGLLDVPERGTNGYKHYTAPHLVRLLQIRRLTELGFSLSQIAEMGGEDRPHDALRALDAELAATVERLQRVRLELAAIMHDGRLPSDLPAHVVPPRVNPHLSAADQSFMVVLTCVVGPRSIAAYREMLARIHDDATCAEFDALAPDADESVRQDLAGRMHDHVLHLRETHPATRDFGDAPRGAAFAAQVVAATIEDLYNPAQIDVLNRLGRS
ncbi:MerR family transcriptional regulator [Aeromicrobium sp. CF3.5]|uniref:MerR family transcriptional regulator n=1 Tax=Aeromicrobium sp. CF3.5 TaxID=3373078 RepID=UPI003EE6CBFB